MEASRIAGIYDQAKLEAHRAIEAAGVYSEVLHALHAARNDSQSAKRLVEEARAQLNGTRKSAKEARKLSEALRDSLQGVHGIAVAAAR